MDQEVARLEDKLDKLMKQHDASIDTTIRGMATFQLELTFREYRGYWTKQLPGLLFPNYWRISKYMAGTDEQWMNCYQNDRHTNVKEDNPCD